MKKVLIAVAICIGMIGLALFSSCSKEYEEKVPEENAIENTVLTRATVKCPNCGRYVSDMAPCMYCSNIGIYGYHCKSCKGKNITTPYGDYKGSCNNCGSDPNWEGLEPCTSIPCQICYKTPEEETTPPLPDFPVEEATFIVAEVSSNVNAYLDPTPYIEAFQYDGVVMEFGYRKYQGKTIHVLLLSGPKNITYWSYDAYANQVLALGLICHIIYYE